MKLRLSPAWVALVAPAFFASCSCKASHSQPEISSVEPTSGPSEGGTPVLISGSGFEEGAIVRFAGLAATEVTVMQDGTIAAVTPPGVGVVAVSVENPSHMVGFLDAAFKYEGTVRCRVAKMEPSVGASDIPVVGDLRIEWSEPILAASLDGTVTLRRLGGDEVPVTVTPDGDRAVVVTPAHSLRFWSSYGLSVTSNVHASLTDETCAGAATAFATVEPEVAERDLRPAAASGIVRIGDVVITAASGYRGLQIWDVSDPSMPDLAGDLEPPESPAGLEVLGDRAYSAAGVQGVIVFDVSDPTAPVRLGRVGTPGRAHELAAFVRGDRTFLAVADGREAVRLLDVTDAPAAIDLGRYEPEAPGLPDVRSVDVQGNLLAVGDWRRGFTIAQLPATISAAGVTTLSTTYWDGHDLFDVQWDGGVLYVSGGVRGVFAYDVNPATSPVQTDVAFGPQGPCVGPPCTNNLSRMRLDGDHLFVAMGRPGVASFAVDHAGGMTLDETYDVDGTATAVAFSATHLFTAAEEGLVVHARGGGGEPLWFDPRGHGFARGVVVRGDQAYVSASFRGLQTFDVSNPLDPTIVDRDDTPGTRNGDIAAFTVGLLAGSVFVGDGREGITLFDTTDPENPIEQGVLDAQDSYAGEHVDGNIIYMCDGNLAVSVIDASDRDTPVEIGRATYEPLGVVESCRDLLKVGDVLYFAGLWELRTLDVGDPTDPTWTGVVPMPVPGGVTSLGLIGDHLVATTAILDFEGRLGVLNRLNVFAGAASGEPELVWQSDDLGGGGDLAVVGDKVFMAGGDMGVFVFDMSTPAEPVLEGIVGVRGRPASVGAGTDAIYSASGAGGLEAISTGPLPL